MKQEQDQIKRLDWVLHFMAIHAQQGLEIEAAWTRIKEAHPTIHIEGNESARQPMFDKLVRDKYMEFKAGSMRPYWITFDGIMFSKKGGYAGEIARLEAEKAIPKKMIWLTLILAAGTIAQVLVAILK